MSPEPFKQDETETPVIFRIGKRKGDKEVTAVFVCEPSTYDGLTMSAYAHVGQHCQCSFSWFYDTNAHRLATPEEYADLKRELESAPYGYKLKVYKRLNRKLRSTYETELKRINAR